MSRLSFILGCVLALLGARVDAAPTNVSVLGVSGPGGPRFVQQLKQDLSDHYRMIAGDRYREKAVELGRTGASPAEVREVAGALHLDIILAGAIAGEGNERRLTLVLRQGADGQVVVRLRYDLGGVTLSLIRPRVVKELVTAIDGAMSAQSDQEGEEVTTPTTPQHPKRYWPPLPPPTSTEEDEDDTAAEGAAGTTREAPKMAGDHTPNPGLLAGVGPAFLLRRLSFNAPGAVGYGGGAVAAIRVDARVQPFGISSELASEHPVLAALGLETSYERALDLKSTVNGVTSTGTASRWRVALIGRIPLGKAAWAGLLTLGLGFQSIGFAHQSPQDLAVPDVSYDLVEGSLGWERSLGTRRLVLSLRAAYEGLTAAGAITGGDQYGHAVGAGFEGEAGLTVWATEWLWLRLDARGTGIWMQFDGTGTRFATRASDAYWDGVLEVGFAL